MSKKKLFCVSDIHSFYNEFIDALTKSGFDSSNENHYLICCGDFFDRGTQPLEVMSYLSGLSRKILIKGNHEQLFVDIIKKHYPDSYDFSNGTFDTIVQLAEIGQEKTDISFSSACALAYKKVRPFFNSMVNFFETENYVFCHSWIPVDSHDGLFSTNQNWREAQQREWDEAMWLNPLNMASSGFSIDKCIVSGHWHSSYGWHKECPSVKEFGVGAKCIPYNYQNKLIMIDACTASTKKVNILVLEDNFID